MVVDDDSDILLLLSKWLTKEGFQVVTVASGEEALTKLNIIQPNLVVTDLFMGGISGMEVLTEVHKNNPLLPVIMLSGQAKIPDRG